jgi:predicted Zn-ribbon and HTH transcriptional regulator
MEQEDRTHQQTIRREMIALLSQRTMTARELSQAMGIREKVVYGHLAHMARTVATRRKRLVVLPFECLGCGYVFKERQRFTPPGRCPRCKKTHLERPTYRVV